MLQRQVVLQRRPACAASAMCSAAMPRVHFSSRTVVPSAVRAAAPLACKASRRASVRVQALGMRKLSALYIKEVHAFTSSGFAARGHLWRSAELAAALHFDSAGVLCFQQCTASLSLSIKFSILLQAINT